MLRWGRQAPDQYETSSRGRGNLMNDPDIPEDLREFILATFASVAELEALLLIRANRTGSWSAEQVARGLYTSEIDAERLLDRLSDEGFLAATGNRRCYQYRCEDADRARMADRVAEVYRRHLVPISHLIHTTPKSRTGPR
jgi:hypothetical protein